MAEYDRSATGPLPVDAGPRRAESIFDMSPADFRASLGEMQALGHDTDALMRQYRARNSIFAPINNAAAAQQQGLADSGRRSVLGGLLSKPEGAMGMDALAGLEFEGLGGLLGAGQAIGQGLDAPAAAAQGLIPQSDVNMEALNTAGMAMGAGGAATAPSGALRSGLAREARDGSNTFGAGTQRVTYRDPESGGFIEVLLRPNGTTSVLGLEVPEGFRGQGIGQSLQRAAMEESPALMGQVSSKAAATTAYRLGRRPFGQPDASLEDVFRMIDKDSSVNLLTPDAQPSAPAANTANNGGLLAPVDTVADAPSPPARDLTERESMAALILDMRASGTARSVTDAMMRGADDQYMFDNTPLPMDEASRLARADSGGFDTGNLLYHGSDNPNITAFDPSKGAEGLPATFLTDSRRVAETYGTNVGEYLARADYPAEFYFDGRSTTNFDNQSVTPGGLVRSVRDAADDAKTYGSETDTDLAFDLQSAGIDPMYADEIDSVRMRSVVDNFGFGGDPANNLAVFDPSNIRNRNARFDPEFSHLSNLSAANASPAAGLLAMQQEQDKPLPFMEMLRGLLR
jgi:hypothetical protein